MKMSSLELEEDQESIWQTLVEHILRTGPELSIEDLKLVGKVYHARRAKPGPGGAYTGGRRFWRSQYSALENWGVILPKGHQALLESGLERGHQRG